MKIGILGAGNVGGSLGKGWAAHGHEIMYSSREPQSDRMKAILTETGPTAQAGTVAETLVYADVILVAMRWDDVRDVVAGAGDWSGKILIDATNRFGGVSPFSAAEDLATIAAGAKVVKAFNTIGAEHVLNPDFNGQAASMFVCGDDANAKQLVMGLAQELGFEAVDAGPLSNASLLESMARLWVWFARSGLGRNIAFKLLKR